MSAVPFDQLTTEALRSLEAELSARHAELRRAGLTLDLTRGKPSPEQLALANELDRTVGEDYVLADGTDVRNYGGLAGIRDARRLGAALLGVREEEVVAGGNSSLTLMYQYLLGAWLNGPLGSDTAWRRDSDDLGFLCVVPGYDRHFTMTEDLGFRMINVEMQVDGPNMDEVERLVASDPSLKGIWCVPKHQNPTGPHVFGGHRGSAGTAGEDCRAKFPDHVGQRLCRPRPLRGRAAAPQSDGPLSSGGHGEQRHHPRVDLQDHEGWRRHRLSRRLTRQPRVVHEAAGRPDDRSGQTEPAAARPFSPRFSTGSTRTCDVMPTSSAPNSRACCDT